MMWINTYKVSVLGVNWREQRMKWGNRPPIQVPRGEVETTWMPVIPSIIGISVESYQDILSIISAFYPPLNIVKRWCLMLVKCWLCASDFAQWPDRLWHTNHHWLRRDYDKLATRHVKSRFPNEPLKLCLKANIGNFRILEVLYLQILWGYSPT